MNAVHVNPDACIACTTCTVYCPVAAQTEAFPGPRMIGPAYERFRLLGMVEDPSLSWCSNCKNCDIACPQGVSIASINMMARAREYEKAHPHFLRDWIVSHSETLAHLIGPLPANLKNGVMKNGLVRGILDMIGIDIQFLFTDIIISCAKWNLIDSGKVVQHGEQIQGFGIPVPVIQGSDFIRFQKLNHEVQIAHILHMMTGIAFKGFKCASIFRFCGLKDFLYGDTEHLCQPVQRSGSALFQIGFAVANIIDCRLRNTAFFAEAVFCHIHFFKLFINQHCSGLLSKLL